MEKLRILPPGFGGLAHGFAVWAWKKTAVRSRILLDTWVADNEFTLVGYRQDFLEKIHTGKLASVRESYV